MDKFNTHILVVDDDEGIRSLVKKYLNENNYLITKFHKLILPNKTSKAKKPDKKVKAYNTSFKFCFASFLSCM